MKKSILLLLLSMLCLSACNDDEVTYKYTEITKGNIENTVTSSGTLEPLKSVDVGTQVSGRITKILVDYNDQVKKGELLAVLDTFLLKLTVDEAKATLDKSTATLEQATSEYQTKKTLYGDSLISQQDFIPYTTSLKSAKANYQSAKIALIKAKRNLSYAYITSPIDGVIIEKEVEEGQTVASSTSAPTLFNVAQDLKEIQILASVDESDIGLVQQGMDVKFSVQAYSEKEYTGKVSQIRLQATTESNVVSYTAVITATNDDLSLLPGMTATVDFITSVTENVLMVPSSALKFSPSEDVMKEFMDEMHTKRMKDVKNEPSKDRKHPEIKKGKRPDRNSMKIVWYMGDDGKLKGIPVKTGDTNGSSTEVSSFSNELKEGLQIVLKSTTVSSSSSKSGEQSVYRRDAHPMRF